MHVVHRCHFRISAFTYCLANSCVPVTEPTRHKYGVAPSLGTSLSMKYYKIHIIYLPSIIIYYSLYIPRTLVPHVCLSIILACIQNQQGVSMLGSKYVATSYLWNVPCPRRKIKSVCTPLKSRY